MGLKGQALSLYRQVGGTGLSGGAVGLSGALASDCPVAPSDCPVAPAPGGFRLVLRRSLSAFKRVLCSASVVLSSTCLRVGSLS